MSQGGEFSTGLTTRDNPSGVVDHNKGMEETTTTIKASTPDDFFTLVPYLLGFHPGESLVAVQIDGRRVGAVARADIAGTAEQVAAAIAPLFDQFPDSDFILMAFGRDRRRGDAVLAATENFLGLNRVIDSLVTDGVRGWSRFNPDPTGWVLPPPDAELCAEAVFAGMAPLSDRLAIVRLCQGPEDGDVPACWEALDDAMVELQDSIEPRAGMLDRLLAVGLANPDALTRVECAQLAILASVIECRDRAWWAMTRPEARAHRDLWLKVVHATPEEWAVPVLCLTGVASWLGGEGALLVSCVERALQLDPDYSMLHILEDLNRFAVPPALWDSMNLADLGDSKR